MLYCDGGASFRRQWAAVNALVVVSTEAPQSWRPFILRLSWYGYFSIVVSFPPKIRKSIWLLGDSLPICGAASRRRKKIIVIKYVFLSRYIPEFNLAKPTDNKLHKQNLTVILMVIEWIERSLPKARAKNATKQKSIASIVLRSFLAMVWSQMPT